MSTLLLRNAATLVTMSAAGEMVDGGLFARDGIIELVGPTGSLPAAADIEIDARHHVVLPGFVNCHGHAFQALTRCLPEAQDVRLGGWLAANAPYWAAMDAEALQAAALVSLAEAAVSGCTTVADQLSHFPNDVRLDVEIEVARRIGLRFVAARGARGDEDPDRVLSDCQRLISTYHDPTPGSHLQIAVGPSNLLRFPAEANRELIGIARSAGAMGHTHLGETTDEIELAERLHGRRPFAFAEDVDWVGPDVWYAHGCYLNPREVERIGRAGGAIAHCPTSNMKLGSRTAPVLSWLRSGVKVGLGVDGPSSNDTSNFVLEMRMALLGQRSRYGPERVTARRILELATAGGAAVLNRGDLGRLAVGYRADLIAFDTRRLSFAGALADPVAAVIFCAPTEVDLNVVDGKVIVRRGAIVGVDRVDAARKLNRAASELRARAQRTSTVPA